MRGRTAAQVHDVFANRIADLQDLCNAIAESLAGGPPRPWMLPPGLQERDLLHVPSMHNPDWERNPINVNYDEAMATTENPGTVGDIISLKLQADYNAVEERAFRLRHATIIRCHTHAHGRHSAHGLDNGVLAAVTQQVADLIRAGGLAQDNNAGVQDIDNNIISEVIV